MLSKATYTSKADLWSIGVVFYQMLFGDYPFFGLNAPELMSKIETSAGNNLKFPDEKNKVSDGVKDLLRSLLQIDPDHRISWEQFFTHPVFKDEQ